MYNTRNHLQCCKAIVILTKKPIYNVIDMYPPLLLSSKGGYISITSIDRLLPLLNCVGYKS